MKHSELLFRAINFAGRCHRGQFRKDGETPYVSHPFRVGMSLIRVFGVEDERILVGALLHDVIEDTNTDFDDLEPEFGSEIAEWVGFLSKDKRFQEDMREKVYREALKDAPAEVKFIKLADIYDNLWDMENVPSVHHFENTLKRSRFYLDAFEGGENSCLSEAVGIVRRVLKEKEEKSEIQGNGR